MVTLPKSRGRGSRRGLKTAAVDRSIWTGTSLGDVLAENGADLRERAVESGCQVAHTSRGSERNECEDQKVLHQSLTCLIALQAGKMVCETFHHCELHKSVGSGSVCLSPASTSERRSTCEAGTLCIMDHVTT